MDTNKKKQVTIPDAFNLITADRLLPGDAILFYHGNKLTEFHGKHRLTKYGRSTLPPFHAAVVYQVTDTEVWILDPEITTGFSSLREYLRRSGYRIDIIRYAMTDVQRLKCIEVMGKIGIEEGYYDVRGYGAFISQMPGLQWLKYIVRPSDKKFYCSDAVTYVLEMGAGIDVSPRDHDFTAPVDLQLFALANPKTCTLFTLKKRGE